MKPILTKRELFSAISLHALLSDSSYEQSSEMYAEQAVEAADKLIKELKNKKPKMFAKHRGNNQ